MEHGAKISLNLRVDDIWIISKNVNFEPKATFVAKSSFYGPSSNGDLEIEPVRSVYNLDCDVSVGHL